MALSAFDDKTHEPRDAEVAAVLGRAGPLWRDLLHELAKQGAPIAQHWGYTSRSTGWGLRLKRGEHTLLYLTPCRGHFLASTSLGEKAVEAARAARVPAALLALIDAAPVYAEGRGVRLDVRDAAGVKQVLALVGIKLAN